MSANIKTTFSKVALFIGLAVSSALADAQAATRFSLPAQPMADSLRAVGTQTNTNVLFDPALVDSVLAPALDEELTRDQALARLLSGTGLTFEALSERTAVVAPLRAARSPTYTKTSMSTGSSASASSAEAAQSDEGNSSGRRSGAENDVTEVVVSAQKRSERLQDVPVPVTAIQAQGLVDSNQVRLQDYYDKIPGLSLTPSAPYGGVTIAIRGLVTSLYANPTVGITVDDVPFQSATAAAAAFVTPEFDPSDLSRVEVLRGPQGTLYGASSIGGLVKYVTVDPSTDQFSGRMQVGVSSIRNGDELGYNVRGSVNMPLSDKWAVRLSGYTRLDPGYIDDPVHNVDGVNRGEASGGRLSALWRPSEHLSLKLGAMFQKDNAYGDSGVTVLPGFSDLQQSFIPGGGGYRNQSQVYTANLNAALPVGELASISAYTVNEAKLFMDFTAGGPIGISSFQFAETKRFTQELRYSLPISSAVDWRIGAYYADEDSPDNYQPLYFADFQTGQISDLFYNYDFPNSYEENAIFTDFTFHLTDKFDLQVGGRSSRSKQTVQNTLSGSSFPTPVVGPTLSTKSNSFTYLVTPQYKVSPDLMIYSRLASGYRPGGPNVNAPLLVPMGLPAGYGEDQTSNYEIGAKGKLFNGLISFDTSIYYIDWQDIQLQLVSSIGGYQSNGSRAKSQGVELSIESRPLNGLTISAWAAYNDAKLTEDLPPEATVFGLSGDRLPFSARWTGNLALDQRFFVTDKATALIGGTTAYVSNRLSGFQTGSQTIRPDFPSYVKTDLRVGLEYESWTLNGFVNNVADKRGLLSGGAGTFYSNVYYFIEPRTFGVSLSKAF